jgi:hypothetical protein
MAAAKIQEEQRVKEEQLGVRCAMMDWLTGKMMQKDTISSNIEVSREYFVAQVLCVGTWEVVSTRAECRRCEGSSAKLKKEGNR